MKNKTLLVATIFCTMLFTPNTYAQEVLEGTQTQDSNENTTEQPAEEPVEEPVEEPNIDVLPTPSQELIDQNPWASSSNDPEPNNDQVGPSSQDEAEGWAVVDQNGNVLNVISCDIDYCGSGWIPTDYDGFTPTKWARVVPQSKRDTQTGNNNGGHWGQYNFSSNTWIRQDEDGSVYQIPTEYGSDPVCIQNCPSIEEDVVEITETSGGFEVIPSESPDLSINSEPRSFNVFAQKTKKTFSFKKKFHVRKNIRGGNVWVVATSDSEKFVWKLRAAKTGKTNIVLPIKYNDWNILINYRLKNGKKISQKMIINN